MENLHNPAQMYVNLIALVAVAALGIGSPASAAGPAEAVQDVIFTKHVAPILQRACQHCHRPGSVAPMSLLTYEEARPWARGMKEKTALREMPPWFVDKNIGIQHFKDDISLSDEEIAIFATWADAGAPRGDAADLPPPIEWADADEWTIGTPDLIVSTPVMTVSAVAADYHGEFGPVPTGLTEDRYVKAVEVKEVRLLDDKTATRRRSRRGFANFTIHHLGIYTGEVVGTTEVSDRALEDRSLFRLTHEIGQNATVYPADTGVVLAAGTEFNFSIHLYASGQEIPVRADIGFTFHPKGYQPKYTQSGFLTLGYIGEDLDIPGDQDNVRVDGFYVMPQHGVMTTYEPHMHSSGKRMCVEAIYPDQSREMLNCSEYDHSWVRVYVYEDGYAPILPKGTVLHSIGWYDNTAKNRNVADPRNWKGTGNRSIDDMFLFLPKMTFLNDEQYAEVVAEREAKIQSRVTNQQN
jgi:hypothetical protein